MRTLLFISILLLTCLQVNAQTSDTLSVVRRDSLEQYKVVVVHDTVYVPMVEKRCRLILRGLFIPNQWGVMTVELPITALSLSINGLVE